MTSRQGTKCGKQNHIKHYNTKRTGIGDIFPSLRHVPQDPLSLMSAARRFP